MSLQYHLFAYYMDLYPKNQASRIEVYVLRVYAAFSVPELKPGGRGDLMATMLALVSQSGREE